MRKEQVLGAVNDAFRVVWGGVPRFRVVNVTDDLVDGVRQVVVEPTGVEPTSRFIYYDDLATVEEVLLEEGVEVMLLPVYSPNVELTIDGEVLEITERQNGDFQVSPKRSLGGPHYRALYDRGGRPLLYSATGTGPREVPAEWLARFDEAAARFKRLSENA